MGIMAAAQRPNISESYTRAATTTKHVLWNQLSSLRVAQVMSSKLAVESLKPS
jgi:hypothetical protein